MQNTNPFVRKIAMLGMLLAAQVVAGVFINIPTPITKIGFTFLPLSIAAILYGPLWGAVSAVLGDFLICVLLGQSYFPPMATTALLSGLLYGLFLYHKPVTLRRVVLCVLTESVLCSLLLNTYWLTFLMGKGFLALLPVRMLQNLITAPVSIFCIRAVSPRLAALVPEGRLTGQRA